MHRLAPMDASIPTCNLGDCLTALNRVDIAPGAERWRFDARVDPEVFAKLEFRETSLGIVKAQRENREGWWAHAQKNRSFIEQAAAIAGTAGAGGGAGGRAAVRSAAGGAGPPVPAAWC